MPRYGVEGTVTFQGTPVTRGKIQIMPDRAKGNRGPQGAAAIVDGAYKIPEESGVITGSVLVVISGGDGQNVNFDEGRPYGEWLVKGHVIAEDFGDGNKEIDFEIP